MCINFISDFSMPKSYLIDLNNHNIKIQTCKIILNVISLSFYCFSLRKIFEPLPEPLHGKMNNLGF